ncbi:MAG: ABC transporter permease [Candidatus Tectomicrobia bacterium]|nr:ABC transporter permease [Candidatus Tectomicrobia bacterium]
MKGVLSRLGFLGRVIRGNPLWLTGYVIVGLGFALMIFAPLIAPFPPEAPNPFDTLQPPNLTHWFGTDATGMDVFSRVVWASRVDLSIAILGTVLSILLGVPLGVLAGFYRGWGSAVILRMADLIQAFPVFVLALVLVALTGQKITNLVYVIAFVNMPIFLRLTRSSVLVLRNKPFVEAGRCMGKSEWNLAFTYILPNAYAPSLIQASISIGFAILLTAGLSFVGAGVRVPTPEWGSIISTGAENMVTGEWWISFFPGLAIAVFILGFALVGDSMKRLLAPGG